MSDFKFNWKELAEDPSLTNEFKWNFAREALKPKMEITGPSVGSLLFAINPETSELGLKQMNDELTQQMAVNEKFDERTKNAMDFVEKRVKEDIDAKTFNEKMKLEAMKANNVDAGHFNSLMSNLSNAYANNLGTIPMLEEQVRRTIPGAEEFLKQAKQNAETAKGQKLVFNQFDWRIPRGELWDSRKDKENFIKEVEANTILSEDQKSELKKSANSISSKEWVRIQADINAKAQNAANKSVNKVNAQDKKTLIENYAKTNGLDLSKPNDRKQAEDWYKINYEGK